MTGQIVPIPDSGTINNYFKRVFLATTLVPLLHDEPPPLLVAETEGLHRERFGRSLVRCLDGPKMVGTRSQNLHAPSPQLGGGVLPSH